jgi:hypothetical protein
MGALRSQSELQQRSAEAVPQFAKERTCTFTVQTSPEPTTESQRFRTHITELRRELRDTLTRIDKLSKQCMTIEDQLGIAEREYAALLE